MGCRPVVRPLFPLLLAAGILSLAGTSIAAAADGVRLVPKGAEAYGLRQRDAQASGPIVAFTVDRWDQPSIPSTVWAIDASSSPRVSWTMREAIGAGPDIPDQSSPCVLTRSGVVRVAWVQHDPFSASAWSIWLWQGSRTGTAQAGYPRTLVAPTTFDSVGHPSLGLVRIDGTDHVILAWEDTRGAQPGGLRVRWLDLTRDGDGDGTPDYREAEFDPGIAGASADDQPTGNQRFPQVGRHGVFWQDGVAEYPDLGGDTVKRLDLRARPLVVSEYWHGDGPESVYGLRATDEGAAFLRFVALVGTNRPVRQPVGASSPRLLQDIDAGSIDVDGSSWALSTGGIPGNGDCRIAFFSRLTGQLMPVCDLGQSTEQIAPAISVAPGGWRVVWQDSRSTTDPDTINWHLRQALVPTVSLTVDQRVVRLGALVKLTAKVAPNYSRRTVVFQTGTRSVKSTTLGTTVTYARWRTVATETLGARSTATYRLRPAARGTYFIHVLFAGGTRYVAKPGYGANHVAASSRWITVVVR